MTNPLKLALENTVWAEASNTPSIAQQIMNDPAWQKRAAAAKQQSEFLKPYEEKLEKLAGTRPWILMDVSDEERAKHRADPDLRCLEIHLSSQWHVRIDYEGEIGPSHWWWKGHRVAKPQDLSASDEKDWINASPGKPVKDRGQWTWMVQEALHSMIYSLMLDGVLDEFFEDLGLA